MAGKATCSADDGKCYVQNGKNFFIDCGNKTAAGNVIASDPAKTLDACIVACSKNAQCVAASLYTGMGTTSCQLLGTYNGRSTSSGATGQLAYVKPASCS